MDKYAQFANSTKGEVSNDSQQFDPFADFPSQTSSLDTLNREPVVAPATTAHAWVKQNMTDEKMQKSGLSRDQSGALDLRMAESPITSNTQNRELPTSVALMMARAKRQTSPSILERYAQTIPLSASCQSVQKRCLFPDCTKMSVSKGLCRGHGGGRRCHFVGGCTKSAQSRSMFCWAHGGGQRCDAEGCMRSRKTKHYCVAHMHLETKNSGSDSSSLSQTSSSGKSSHGPRARRSRYVPVPSRNSRLPSQGVLPSLGQALSAASLSLPTFPILPQARAQCLLK